MKLKQELKKLSVTNLNFDLPLDNISSFNIQNTNLYFYRNTTQISQLFKVDLTKNEFKPLKIT